MPPLEIEGWTVKKLEKTIASHCSMTLLNSRNCLYFRFFMLKKWDPQ